MSNELAFYEIESNRRNDEEKNEEYLLFKAFNAVGRRPSIIAFAAAFGRPFMRTNGLQLRQDGIPFFDQRLNDGFAPLDFRQGRIGGVARDGRLRLVY